MRIPAPHGCEHLAGQIPFAMTTSNPDLVKVYEHGRFHNKPVKVEPFTMNNMNAAQKLIWDVKLRELPYGAGNQYSDIVRTMGESGVRAKMSRNMQEQGGHVGLYPHWRQVARYASRYGAGNCQEFSASVLEKLEQSNLRHPIGIARISTRHPDRPHVVPYIGDERDRRYGTTNTVLMPTWEVYPTVTTLAQSKYEIDCHVAELSANPAFPAPPVTQMGSAVTTGEVNAFLAAGRWPAVGPALVRKILREEANEIANGGQPYLYEHLFGTDKPDKTYYSRNDAGKSFNVIPAEYWNKRQAAMASIQRDYGADIANTPYDPSGRDVEVTQSWSSRLKKRLTK